MKPGESSAIGAMAGGVVSKTYCRICEAHCGLEVEVNAEGRIGSVRPDRSHPVTRGYACVKGIALKGLHTDPDRLDHPMKRIDGRLQRITWEQAIQEIGNWVKTLRSAHGDRCIAMYQGNPTYFSFQNILFSSAFVESIGSPNLFASHSLDLNNKFQASTEIYGHSMVHPVPDFEHLRFLMILGSNPMVSQMSVVQLPHAVDALKQIKDRGGRVIIVDPRRTETADKVGEHVFIRPGTDVYLLLAMLHVVAIENAPDTRRARRFADGVDRFIECARDWSPESVSPITGVPSDTIRAIANAYRSADGAALHMSTGVNMGPFGSVCYWLIQGLNLITDNADRQGGLLFPRGAFDAVRLARALGLGSFDAHRTLKSGWHRVAGCFPSAVLAEEIEVDHPERIRALVVSAGNPIHSIPGGENLTRAFGRLDLLVCIDIYPSETSALADYVLPATDMLERSDFAASHMVLQPRPHAQFTEAIVDPLQERRPEWRIFSDLALACGAEFSAKSICNLVPHLNRFLSRLPGFRRHPSRPPIHPDHLLALMLRWGRRVSLARLRTEPAGVLLEPTAPGSFLGRRVPTESGRVQLWPENLAQDLARVRSMATADGPPGEELRLIGRRDRRTHNSWMHNNPEIRHPARWVATIHPVDAAVRGIEEGDAVEISSAQGCIQATAGLSTDVMQGVLAVPHGWGHRESGLTKAAEMPGDNINRVIPGGPEHMEPVSGQAIMVGHRVTLRRLPCA